jgi:multidrug resistance efflux pump
VQKLEEKLDAILEELRSLRGTTDPRKPVPSPRGGSRGSGGGRESLWPQSTRPEMAKSPDGKVVAVVTPDGNVSLADAETGKQLRNIVVGLAPEGRSVAFSPDGKLLIARGEGKVVEFDAATGAVVRQTIESGSSGGGGPAASGDRQSREWRGDLAADGAGEFRVFALKFSNAAEVQATLQELGLVKLRISSISRTNSIIVAGPADQLALVEVLIRKLDVPADAEATPPKSTVSPIEAPPVQRGNPSAPAVGSGSQLDLVSLGTATIEARGALRLAQAQHNRLKKLGSAAAVSQEEVEAAEIKLETAQQQVELLSSVARSAGDSANAELLAARAAAEHARKLYEKGFMTQSQVEQAQALILAAEAKLKLVESIVGPTPPPHAAVDKAAVEIAEINAARAAVDGATANAKRLIELRDKGGATASEVEHAEAEVLAAQAKLKLLEAKLSPKAPPSSGAKSKDATQPDPKAKRR